MANRWKHLILRRHGRDVKLKGMLAVDQSRSWTEAEQARTEDFSRILPKDGGRGLDVGARDGRISRILAQYYSPVIALDLVRPSFSIDGVETVAGDATHLEYPDQSFDCVTCTEVLEHVPELGRACQEIQRVAKRYVVIGVPYRQDLRIARTTCLACGAINPPWGHVHRFDEARLRALFSGLELVAINYVWPQRGVTNPLSTLLMDLGGNPWGAYDQQEPCIRCGEKLRAPGKRGITKRICSAAAETLNRMQSALTPPRATWVHAVFQRGARAATTG